MSDNRLPNIGDMAPDFELPDIDMKMIKLSEYLGKGTLVLAFFPASKNLLLVRLKCAHLGIRLMN